MFNFFKSQVSPIRLLGLFIIAIGGLTIVVSSLAVVGQVHQNLTVTAQAETPVAAAELSREDIILGTDEDLSAAMAEIANDLIELEPAAGEVLQESDEIFHEKISTNTIVIENTSR